MSETDVDVSRSQASVVRRYLEARDEVDRLTALLDKAKEKVERCEHDVMDLYVEEGFQSVRVDGKLVSITKTLWARPTPGEEHALLAALEAEGYGALVNTKVNPSTLSALVREHTREDDPLPESIMAHVTVAEKFGLSLRKS